MLEIGIFSSHLVWLARTRKIRKAAAAEGRTFDDIAAEHEARGIPFKFAARRAARTEESKESSGGDIEMGGVERAA